MPFKSQAQRAFMYSQHPEIAKRFEKETPKGKELPSHVGKKEMDKRHRSRMNNQAEKMMFHSQRSS